MLGGQFYYLSSTGQDPSLAQTKSPSIAVGSTDGWMWTGIASLANNDGNVASRGTALHVSHGYMPQIMDTAPLAEGGLLLATRRLKYYCAKKDGTPCAVGENGESMSYTDVRQKAWVYYVEKVDATTVENRAKSTQQLFTPAVKTNWTEAAAHWLPKKNAADEKTKTDLEGNPVLFEAKCGLPYFVDHGEGS